MDALYRFFVQFELYIYLTLAIGAIFSARSLWKVWVEWRTSVFGLEKELSFQKVRIYGSLFILLMMIGLTLFCLVTFVVPFLPSTTFRMTPTANLLQTPAATLSAQDLTAQIGSPVATVFAGSPGCIAEQVFISSPLPGSNVKGKIILTGTVNVPSFGFFKYEYASIGSDNWTTIAAKDQIVKNGDLGAWDTSQMTPGDYQLRLLVTDNLGKALPPCILQIHVLAP